jgi:serine/threonine-protein kinase HSL1, negative regulator of Swe1 kinase
MHKVGLFRRDLKVENMLLDSEHNIKMNAAGDAKTMGRKSSYYGAPEAIDGKTCDGAKADVWSLGVMLYFMVCKNLPFTIKDGIADLHDNVKTGKIFFPKNVSK